MWLCFQTVRKFDFAQFLTVLANKPIRDFLSYFFQQSDISATVHVLVNQDEQALYVHKNHLFGETVLGTPGTKEGFKTFQ